jgi:hypothetical protein
VKRLVALAAGGLGIGAWLRRRRRLRQAELGPSPADDLRAKLAEARAAAEVEPPVGEQPAAAGEAGADDPDARRRDVHDRARAAIDELG